MLLRTWGMLSYFYGQRLKEGKSTPNGNSGMLNPSYASSRDGPNVGEHQIGFGGRLPVSLLLPLVGCIKLSHFSPVCLIQVFQSDLME